MRCLGQVEVLLMTRPTERGLCILTRRTELDIDGEQAACVIGLDMVWCGMVW